MTNTDYKAEYDVLAAIGIFETDICLDFENREYNENYTQEDHSKEILNNARKVLNNSKWKADPINEIEHIIQSMSEVNYLYTKLLANDLQSDNITTKERDEYIRLIVHMSQKWDRIEGYLDSQESTKPSHVMSCSS